MGQTHSVGRVATSVTTDDGKTRVTYHSTVVVAWDDKTITLRSGGWQTHTTKTRMNQASNQYGLGFYVWQKDHKWWVSLPGGGTTDFIDGMTFPRAK